MKTLIAIAAILVGFPDGVSGQLTVRKIREIPSERNGVVITGAPSVAFSKGAFVFAPTYDGAVAVVSNDATFRQLGRAGNGPKEFPAGNLGGLIAGNDGTLFIINNTRMSELSPGGTEIVRQITLPWRPMSALFMADTIIAVRPVRDSIARPEVHKISLRGNDVSHFDLSNTPAPDPTSALYQLGPALAPGHFWVSRVNGYVVKLYNANGRVVRSISRSPSWFVSGSFSNPLLERPAARVVGVKELPNSVLLVLSLVPDSKWTPTSAKMDLRDVRTEPLFDTVIEALDATSGALLATFRSPLVFRFVSGSDYLWTSREVPSGDVVFEVHELNMRR